MELNSPIKMNVTYFKLKFSELETDAIQSLRQWLQVLYKPGSLFIHISYTGTAMLSVKCSFLCVGGMFIN